MEATNIILIVLDTLRKDYGEKYLHPILKKYGFNYYSNTIAPAPWTTPSHASIFTGLYPALHGAHETKKYKSDKVKLLHNNILTRELKLLGYSNYLLSANMFVTPYFGFVGFDKVVVPTKKFPRILSKRESKKLQRYSSTNSIQTAFKLLEHGEFLLLLKASIQKVILDNYLTLKVYGKLRKWPLDLGLSEFTQWISSFKFKSPMFMTINLMEMHEPYPTLPKSSVINYQTVKSWVGKPSEKIVTGYKKGYEMEIKYLSENLPKLLNALKKKGLFDNSLVIILSDHGQLLGEHGKINHGTFLYDELIQVPLWIKYPWESEPVKCSNGYISLTKIRDLIIDVAEGRYYNDKKLYSSTVFSEVYGTHIDYSRMNLSHEELEKIRELEKYRIAVYYKNFKGIFNVTDWKFDEVISYDPGIEVTEDVVKHLKKEVMKFLKTATIAKVPKIKV
ncbi:sulfatase-like hydrolase/transferase [Thermococcus gorgonarius]|uniref:Sulfatase N-terminal domain-containing protein n=1 Tax=Thermococcus gorgonarius TaxID=71997 RepID=A0A2Z2M9Y5_THEGO|nr:sulfatase-like hydrolase/transferase [Thermococcus gorgonarius]ASJ01305.1 hypothetical protein A3K92_07330 [Thermococcus gorgonarius]